MLPSQEIFSPGQNVVRTRLDFFLLSAQECSIPNQSVLEKKSANDYHKLQPKNIIFLLGNAINPLILKAGDTNAMQIMFNVQARTRFKCNVWVPLGVFFFQDDRQFYAFLFLTFKNNIFYGQLTASERILLCNHE